MIQIEMMPAPLVLLVLNRLLVSALLLNLMIRQIVELEIYVKLIQIATVSLSLPIQIEALNVLLSLELALGTLNVLVIV